LFTGVCGGGRFGQGTRATVARRSLEAVTLHMTDALCQKSHRTRAQVYLRPTDIQLGLFLKCLRTPFLLSPNSQLNSTIHERSIIHSNNRSKMFLLIRKTPLPSSPELSVLRSTLCSRIALQKCRLTPYLINLSGLRACSCCVIPA